MNTIEYFKERFDQLQSDNKDSGLFSIRKNAFVLVSFNVASQINISSYSIERSQDGRIFTTVAILGYGGGVY